MDRIKKIFIGIYNKFKNDKSFRQITIRSTIVILITLVLFGGSFFFVKYNNKPKEKTVSEVVISKEMLADKTYSNLDITNIEIEDTESLTHMMADVYNNSEQKFNAGMVKIVFQDKDSKEIGSIKAYISDVEAGDSVRIDVAIDKEFKTAYNFKIVEE